MTMRGARVALHWTVAVLVAALGLAREPGPGALIGGLLAVAVPAWIALLAVSGAWARPPRRPLWARALHLAVHRGQIAALAALVATGLPAGMAGETVAAALGGPSGDAAYAWSYRAVLALAGAHLFLAMGREAVGGEAIFRRMLPL